MPRIVYTMANDGLVYQMFGRIAPKFKTPWVASLITGIFAGYFHIFILTTR
jgi:amino acid transporter